MRGPNVHCASLLKCLQSILGPKSNKKTTMFTTSASLVDMYHHKEALPLVHGTELNCNCVHVCGWS